MKGDENNDPRWVEMTRKEILEEKKIGGAGIKFDFDLTDQEKSMIKDPILDTCGSLEFAVSLIIKMREIINTNNYHYTPYFHLTYLKKFREASYNSDYWKCVQAAQNNGDLFTKSFNLAQQKYLAKSQKLRTEIINNLEWWILDSSFLRNTKPKPLNREQIGDIDVNYLTPEHFQEIRNLTIKDIKETAEEWQIVKSVGWLDEETGEEWYVELVLQNAKKPHRRFNIRTFTKREWEEIKQVVKNHQCKEMEEEYLNRGFRWEEQDLPEQTPKKNQPKNNQTQPSEKNPANQNFPFLLILLIGIGLLVLVGIGMFYKKRKRL